MLSSLYNLKVRLSCFAPVEGFAQPGKNVLDHAYAAMIMHFDMPVLLTEECEIGAWQDTAWHGIYAALKSARKQ